MENNPVLATITKRSNAGAAHIQVPGDSNERNDDGHYYLTSDECAQLGNPSIGSTVWVARRGGNYWAVFPQPSMPETPSWATPILYRVTVPCPNYDRVYGVPDSPKHGTEELTFWKDEFDKHGLPMPSRKGELFWAASRRKGGPRYAAKPPESRPSGPVGQPAPSPAIDYEKLADLVVSKLVEKIKRAL